MSKKTQEVHKYTPESVRLQRLAEKLHGLAAMHALDATVWSVRARLQEDAFLLLEFETCARQGVDAADTYSSRADTLECLAADRARQEERFEVYG